MSGERPVVVSVRAEDSPWYLEALEVLGVPRERIRILPADDGADREEVMAAAGGLLLAGGRDIDPALWGDETLPGSNLSLEPERDESERRLFEAARANRVPVLGICRGMQYLNVLFGGTLYQDLGLEHPSPLEHFVAEPRDRMAHALVDVRDVGPVGEILAAAAEPRDVNSRHHQAVKDLAPGLELLAASPDGVVEAFHLPQSDWWLNAVQWHPENLLHHPMHRGVMESFLDAVEGSRR